MAGCGAALKQNYGFAFQRELLGQKAGAKFFYCSKTMSCSLLLCRAQHPGFFIGSCYANQA